MNRRSGELVNATVGALSSLAGLKPLISWVSPLETELFVEYKDDDFLKAVEFERITDKLANFWPRRGPNWDALAIVESQDGSKGILLVEAKSYPGEVFGSGCQAEPESLAKIQDALNETKRWLGVDPDIDWTGRLYQSANRLAHLYFLQEVAQIPAWLVNVCFANDPHRPTGVYEWGEFLPAVKAEMGLAGKELPHAADILLQARDRSELLANE